MRDIKFQRWRTNEAQNNEHGKRYQTVGRNDSNQQVHEMSNNMVMDIKQLGQTNKRSKNIKQ